MVKNNNYLIYQEKCEYYNIIIKLIYKIKLIF